MFVSGAIVSLCFIPGWTGAIIPTQYAVLSIALPFTLWRRGPFTVFHWLGIALVIYAVTSLLWNTDFYSGVYGFWLACIMALSFWLGSTLHSLRELYKGLAVGAVVSSAVAVLQAMGFQVLPTVTSYPAGIYFNSIAQGEILALVAIALLTERMYYFAVPLLPGIVLAQSRGAWLALIVGVAGLYVRKVWLLAFVAALGSVLLFANSPSDAQRLWFWQAAFNELTFFGNGVGSFASQMYSNGIVPVYPEFVHNDVLQLTYEYGFAAIIPIVIFAFVLRQTKAREWPVVLVFVTMGLYSFPLWMAITSFIGMVAAGRIVRSWHMDGRFSDYCRQVSLSRRWANSRSTVSVVGANKGSC